MQNKGLQGVFCIVPMAAEFTAWKGHGLEVQDLKCYHRPLWFWYFPLYADLLLQTTQR